MLKKLFLLAIFSLLCSTGHAATRTWTGAGADNLASTALNWDTAAPGAGDAAVFDGAFPVTGNKNCTFDVTASLLSIDTTGYTGTVTANGAMTVTGGITFANSTFAHNNQTFNLEGSQTINTGTAGNSFYNLSVNAGTYTFTLSNDVTINNTFNFNSGGISTTINGAGKSWNCKGNVTGITSDLRGTATLVINGSGNQTVAFGSVNISITINSSGGTVTFSQSFNIDTSGKTYTYTV